MTKNIVCIIQARVGSTRLPNKIFLEIEGKAVLGWDIERIEQSNLINKIVVASPDSPENDIIKNYVEKNYPQVGIYRGSENDVLDRYHAAAKKYKADVVIRITSDCPLIDAGVVDKVIQVFFDSNVDYASNVLGERNFPRGFDTEVFSFANLEKIWKEAKEKEDREHVTLYLRKHPELFTTSGVSNDKDYSFYRLTLDEQDDYELIKIIYQKLLPQNNFFSLKEIIKLLEDNPELKKINEHVEQKYAKY